MPYGCNGKYDRDQRSRYRGTRYLRWYEVAEMLRAVERARGWRSAREQHRATGIALLRAALEQNYGARA